MSNYGSHSGEKANTKRKTNAEFKITMEVQLWSEFFWVGQLLSEFFWCEN
jgi:hypothetical protein